MLRAFNSPFWPFVLASTSVGQEGLDFHVYCHAVVHWNLPGNPVDLEQREGRVHRRQGHAVRRNVAARFGGVVGAADVAGAGAACDPWEAMFDAAAAERAEGEPEIVPHWVYAGEARIERYVPALPLSAEAARYRRLLRAVGACRLAFGQPRQEDLVALVGDRVEELKGLRVRLGP